MALFTTLLSARFAGQFSKAFSCTVRQYGSSPEMPIVGSKEWQSMLNNLRAQQMQPPLSRADILNSQRLSIIESDMNAIKEMMVKVVDSNKHLQESFERLQEKIIFPQQ